MKGSGASVSRSAKASARASTRRESWLETVVIAIETMASDTSSGGSTAGVPARPARCQPLGQPLAGEQRRRGPPAPGTAARAARRGSARGRARGRRPAGRSVAREALQQRVVEDDALGRAEAGHVGVGRGRAAAGVDLVDLAHLHAGALGEVEHVAAHGPGRERRELVEKRVEHGGPGVDEHAAPMPTTTAEPGAHQRRGKRRISASSSAPPRREHRADRRGLGDVARPAAPRLGRPGRRRSRAGARSRRAAAWPASGRPTAPRPRPPPPSSGRRDRRRAAAAAGGTSSSTSRPPSISSRAP